MMPAPVRLLRGRTWRASRPAETSRRRKRFAASTRAPGSPSAPRPSRSAVTRPIDVERKIGLALIRFTPDLIRWALRCGVRAADAPDVAQLAAVAAWRSWESCELPAEQRQPWLFAIVVRVAWRFQRRTARQPIELRDPGDMEHEADPASLPGEALEERERVATLEELRAGTTPDRWRVFLAFEIEGLAAGVLAKRENVPLGTVYNRLRLARRDVQAVVRRHRAALAHAEQTGAARAAGKRRAPSEGEPTIDLERTTTRARTPRDSAPTGRK